MNKNEEIAFEGLKLRTDLHVVRKLWHMGTGLSGLAWFISSGWTKEKMAMVLLSLSLAAFMVEFLRLFNSTVNDGVMKVMGPFMRESERQGLSGFPFYALGTSLSLFFFSEKIAILAVLFLIFSDPISSFFGILYGRERLVQGKSFQGFLAGFSTCYLVTLFYLMVYDVGGANSIVFALLAGVVGALSELLSVLIDDNLTIPLLSGLGLTLLNSLFGIF